MNAYLMGYMGKEARASWWNIPGRVGEAVGEAVVDVQPHKKRVLEYAGQPTPKMWGVAQALEGTPGYTPHDNPISRGEHRSEIGTYNPWRSAKQFWGEKAETLRDQAEAYRQANPGLYPEYAQPDGTVAPTNHDRDIPVHRTTQVARPGRGQAYYSMGDPGGADPQPSHIGFDGYNTRSFYGPGLPVNSGGTLADERANNYNALGPYSMRVKASGGRAINYDEWQRNMRATLFHEGVHGITMPPYKTAPDGKSLEGPYIDGEEVTAIKDAAIANFDDYRDRDASPSGEPPLKHPTYVEFPGEADPPAAAFNRAASTLGLEFPRTVAEGKANINKVLEQLKANPDMDLDPEARRFIEYWERGDDTTKERLLGALPGAFANTGNPYQQGYASHA